MTNDLPAKTAYDLLSPRDIKTIPADRVALFMSDLAVLLKQSPPMWHSLTWVDDNLPDDDERGGRALMVYFQGDDRDIELDAPRRVKGAKL